MITEEQIELRRREPGAIQPTTWGGVAVGHILRWDDDRFHTVMQDKSGWVQLQSVKTGELWPHRRPAPETPIDIYVPSDEEAIFLLHEGIGASVLRDIESREHSIARALTWQVEPVASTAVALRDHIDFMHAINVDDVLRQQQGTKANPVPKGQKAAKLQELRDLHDEAHNDPDLWPMSRAHSHHLNPKKGD